MTTLEPSSASVAGASLEERREIQRAALDLEIGNPVPMLVEPFSMDYASAETLDDHALDLERQIAQNQAQIDVGDHWLPHLKPGTGLGAIATAFGCAYRVDSQADAWVLPLIKDDPREAYRIRMPDSQPGGLARLFYEKAAYFQAQSDVPLCSCNVPSPLTTASMIWDYSAFLQAMVETPSAVHHLLEMITEYTIAFLRANRAAIRNLWGFTHMNWYVPPEYGVRVSDDVLAVISPRQYREFGVRYNNRLSAAFGGIVVHSCGNVTHNLPAIMETEGLRGIEITLPHNDIHKIAAFSGRTAFMLRYWLQDWEDSKAPDLETYTAGVLELLGTRGILLEMQVPSCTHEEAVILAARLQAHDWRSR